MTTHDGYGDRWLDREAGPVVRPYALTQGRTLPSGGASFGFERNNMPFVIAVNCFDGAQRFQPDDIRIALSLGPGVPVVLCDARDRDSVKKVLISLVKYVMSTGSRASQISIA